MELFGKQNRKRQKNNFMNVESENMHVASVVQREAERWNKWKHMINCVFNRTQDC